MGFYVLKNSINRADELQESNILFRQIQIFNRCQFNCHYILSSPKKIYLQDIKAAVIVIISARPPADRTASLCCSQSWLDKVGKVSWSQCSWEAAFTRTGHCRCHNVLRCRGSGCMSWQITEFWIASDGCSIRVWRAEQRNHVVRSARQPQSSVCERVLCCSALWVDGRPERYFIKHQ